MSIPNLKEMDTKFQAVSRTNIIDLDGDYRELVERILVSESNRFGIDMVSLIFKRGRISGKQESIADYKQRIHREFADEIKDRIDGDFEENSVRSHVVMLEKMGDGKELYVSFFVNRTIDVDEFMAEDLLEDLSTYSEPQIRYMLQGLMALLMKISVIEISDGNEVTRGEMLNTRLLLMPDFQHKKSFSLVTAFEPSCFLSEQGELCIDVAYRVMRLTEADQTLISDTTNSLLTDPENHKKYTIDRSFDGRKNKDRPAYGSGMKFPKSRIFALELATKSLEDKLLNLGISAQRLLFTPYLEVDSFAQGIDSSTSGMSKRFLVTVPVAVEDAESSYLSVANLYSETLSAELISFDEYKSMSGKSGCSFLFLNPVNKESEGSIIYFNSELRKELIVKDKLKSFPTFNSTFQAYQRKCKDFDNGVKGTFFDPYTEEKISLLERNLKGSFEDYALQGVDLLLKDSDEIIASASEPKSEVAIKTKRIGAELAFKEALYGGRVIPFTGVNFELNDGEYLVSYIRSVKGEKTNEGEGSYFHGQVGLSVEDNTVSITSKRFEAGSKRSLEAYAPYLNKFKVIYNESFFLHSVSSGETLTSYHSLRTPLILCNAVYDPVVEWEKHYKKVARPFLDDGGLESKVPLGIFRKGSDAKTGLLPFYNLPKRKKEDEMTISEAQAYHHIFLAPHDDGLHVLVTPTYSSGKVVTKQRLIKNVISLDGEGQRLNWPDSELVGEYLNSHTLDILSLNETSKTSLFTKLAKVLVEN